MTGALQAARAADAELAPPAEVVVSASRVPVPPREAGTAVSVITEDQLEDRQVRLVSDVLRDLPGLAVGRTGPVGGLTQVRIRGAEGNQTLVLIDGIEVNNPASSSEFDFGTLLNAEVARIEVLRGPQSALYGSDAIGGVINIVTKRPGRGWSLTARSEAGSFATREALGHLGYGGDRFYLAGTFNRHVTNGVSAADEDAGNPEADGYRNATGRLKSGLRLAPNLEIEAVGMYVTSDLETDADAAGVGAEDDDTSTEILQRYGLVKGTWTLMEGAWEHILRASFTSEKRDFFNGAGDITFISDGARDKYDYQTNLFLGSGALGGIDHTLTFAAERERERIFTESAFAGPNPKSVENQGYVGEYRVDVAAKLFLSAGLRHDDNDALFSDATTWRTTAAWLHDPWSARFHTSAGTGVKNPTLFELFGSTPSFTGNPDLKPEESFGWDVGVEKAFFGGRLTADVTYFENRIDDLIDGSGSTAENISGESVIRGVEISAAAEPMPGLRLDASYTFTDAEDADGIQLTRRAKHIASLNARYAFDLEARPATVNLGIRYNGRQTDTLFESFFPVVRRTVELDAYTLVNIGFSWALTDRVELFARTENALDQEYQEVFGFGAPDFGAFAGLRVNLGETK